MDVLTYITDGPKILGGRFSVNTIMILKIEFTCNVLVLVLFTGHMSLHTATTSVKFSLLIIFNPTIIKISAKKRLKNNHINYFDCFALLGRLKQVR